MTNFLIETDNYFIIRDKLDELKKELNIEVEETYYLAETSITSIIADLNIPSFFNENKLIIIKDADEIETIKEKEYQLLLKYLSSSSDFASLALIIKPNYKKRISEIKKTTVFYSLLVKNKSSEEFINNYLENEGFKIDNKVKEYIASFSDDFLQIKNILDTLICMNYDEKTFSIDDIKKILNRPLENNIYDLSKHVLSRNKKEAFNLYEDLKIQKVNISFMICLLLDRLIELYDTYELSKSNLDNNKIADVLNIKPGKVYYLQKDLKNIRINDLSKLIDDLINLDFKIKSGNISDTLGFEKFLLSI